MNPIARDSSSSESGFAALPKDSPIREVLGQLDPRKEVRATRDLVGAMFLLCSAAGAGSRDRRIPSTAVGFMRL